MKNIAHDLDMYEDDDYFTVERFGRKPSFRGEDYRRERKGDNIRRKRQQKEKERQQLMEESDWEQ